MNLSKWKSHETDSLKASIIILIIAACALFIASKTFFRDNFLTGMVNPADAAGLQITLTSYPDADPVEPGIYGVGAAKMYDEMATETDWLETASTLMEDLAPTTLRFPAGGVVKYSHVFTEHMTQPLTAEEQAMVVDVGFGPELRGVGQIEADRIDEEARGNDGELAEIVDPKPAYNNLSYIDGFQNLMPRNFIHDAVEIVNASGTDMLYVINMRYASPAEIADQVAYLLDQGVEIQGYEFDNEVYAKGGFYYQAGTPSIKAPLAVTEYLNDADSYKSAILAVDPDAVFAVVAAPKKDFEEGGLGVEDTDSNFNSEWNIALASQMDAHGYSNYVVHFYHGFFTCLDTISTGVRDSIFSCGTNELRYLNDSVTGPTDTTSIPPMLTAFYNQFAGKNLWLTEWNINQDPNRTDSKYANSILHASLTQQFINILNNANATYGNFIKHATYHTFATDGGNAMINKRSGKGANMEPDDIGGFVRRTPYYAFMSMRDIMRGEYTPMQTTFSTGDATVSLDDIVVYGYKDASGDIALSVSNLSGKTFFVESLTVDGQLVDLSTSDTTLFAIDGDATYSSHGDTDFATNPGYEVTTRDDEYTSVNGAYVPAYGIGTMLIETDYITAAEVRACSDGVDNDGDGLTDYPVDPGCNKSKDNDETDDCGFVGGIFGTCGDEEDTGGDDDTPVAGDTKKPEVVLTAPTTAGPLGAGLLIKARATDNTGVTKVEFYAEPLGVINTDTSEPYSYQWDTTGVAPGAYMIKAKAYDAAGNTSLSATVKMVK